VLILLLLKLAQGPKALRFQGGSPLRVYAPPSMSGPLPERPGLQTLSSVDPLAVRFAHSRVRPVFSGCGRRLEATLAALSCGALPLASLPPMAVLALPGGLLVSLNNRRLWVLQALARAAWRRRRLTLAASSPATRRACGACFC
jgi:hypothetical protein